MQENAWEITVARAAPRTPMWNPKIKTGSRIMLEIAPINTESIPVFANPWAVMKCIHAKSQLYKDSSYVHRYSCNPPHSRWCLHWHRMQGEGCGFRETG